MRPIRAAGVIIRAKISVSSAMPSHLPSTKPVFMDNRKYQRNQRGMTHAVQAKATHKVIQISKGRVVK